MYNDARRKIQDVRNNVNEQQENIRKEKGYVSPQFVVHATHVSQEEYRKSAPNIFEGTSSETEIVPAFSKDTQNELNAFKILFSTLTLEELKALKSNTPEAPKRVFAMSSKQDDKGNTVFDEKGIPVPYDGSYAFAFKPCSKCICFLEDSNTHLLIGLRDAYDGFEKGKQSGHLYIGRGDTFKPEYDSQGNITEWTSSENMEVVYHIKTTPQEAMQHNVQFVVFNNAEDYDKWSKKVHEKEKDFNRFISSDNYRVTSLHEEILNGRATYINATSKGSNPKISGLTKATAEYCKLINSNRIRV
jgi:hypothetical protein